VFQSKHPRIGIDEARSETRKQTFMLHIHITIFSMSSCGTDAKVASRMRASAATWEEEDTWHMREEDHVR